MIHLKYYSLGVKQQSITQINVSFVFFAFSDPFTMQYSEGDVAMLTCSDEYNETIQLSSVLYSYNTCSHDDKYGIQNLCDGRKSCSFYVTNSNLGSSCGADGKASLQVSYYCKRKLYFIQTLIDLIKQFIFIFITNKLQCYLVIELIKHSWYLRTNNDLQNTITVFDNYFTYFVPVFKYCYSDSRNL